MKTAVIVFPGSNCDRDLAVALEAVTGATPRDGLARATPTLPDGIDLVAVPGGFSYGDYLRSGAIAARSPIMRAVVEAAGKGVPVLGVCNGFQVLTEAGLLPGALMRNAGLNFVCRDVALTVGERAVGLHQPAMRAGETDHVPGRAPRRQLFRRRRDARPARGRGPRRVPLRRAPSTARARDIAGILNDARQRARHDAAPRAPDRSRRTAAPTGGGCSRGWWRRSPPRAPCPRARRGR